MKSPTPVMFESLTGTRRDLVLLIDQLQFGRIEYLEIRAGCPVFQPPLVILRTIKLNERTCTDEETPRNYALKAETVKVLAEIEKLQNGMIRRLEVRHGLPIVMEVEQRILLCPTVPASDSHRGNDGRAM